MTDTDKLKRLEMVRRVARVSDRTGRPVMIEADDCRAILALIAERDEAVALLRRLDGYDFAGSPVQDAILGFLARIETKQQG